MHELSLCRAIAATASEHASGRRVLAVHVSIGHFRQVVPDTLAYCWELHTRATGLDGCRLEVTAVPAVIHCDDCGADTTLELPVVVCGRCGGRRAQLVSGEEFLIEAIDVEPAAAPQEVG